jgi:hypothetical protein
MEHAFSELQCLVEREERSVQNNLILQELKIALQNDDACKLARKQREKAIHRMLRELRSQRVAYAVQDKSGRVVMERVGVARALCDFWSSICPGQLPDVFACRQWLNGLNLPAQWKTTLPLLLRPRSPAVLEESLKRMDGTSAPGDDGIQARCYQQFSAFFLPRMEEVFQDLEKGLPLPQEWTRALVRPIPKKQGAVRVDEQRPIALQQCKLKWMMTTILVQVEDAFAQLIPPQQRAYVKGRSMEDHLVAVACAWGEKLPHGMADAWVGIDYSKAYDSVNHALVEALLAFIGMPEFMISICLQVMRGDVFFLVGKLPVMEVALKPTSGIRQGDPFSPLVFVLLASLVLFIGRLQGCNLWLYSDDAFVRVTCLASDLKSRVGDLLSMVQEFGQWSGLKINVAKSEIMLRGVSHEVFWHGIKVVPYVRYLGAFIGEIDAEKSFAPALAKVWPRLCWLGTAPLSMEEKRHLVHSWVYPC